MLPLQGAAAIVLLQRGSALETGPVADLLHSLRASVQAVAEEVAYDKLHVRMGTVEAGSQVRSQSDQFRMKLDRDFYCLRSTVGARV